MPGWAGHHEMAPNLSPRLVRLFFLHPSRRSGPSLRSFFQLARKLLHSLTHHFARLELYSGSGRDDKTAARLVRISPYTRLGQARLEYAEIAQLHRNVIGQAVGNLVEGALNHIEYLVLDFARLVTDGDDNVSFG